MNTAAVEHRVRARLGTWPYEPDVAHLVLLDHHMVPDAAAVARWLEEARANGSRIVRTGALFPPSIPAFLDAGFENIDTLRLLERRLDPPLPDLATTSSTPRLRRMRATMLDEAADVDNQAFRPPWRNDASALADIVSATPQHRARCIRVDGRIVAFIISGRATTTGYIQRLAVDPDAQRNGFGRALVVDALGWMQRRRVTRVLVNTALDNHAASALYESCGFREGTDRLGILERTLT